MMQRALLTHEKGLTSLALLTALALFRAGDAALAVEAAAGAGALLAGVALSQRLSMAAAARIRLAAAYLFVFWFYVTVERFVPALALPVMDEQLLRTDQLLFGVTPSVTLGLVAMPRVTDVMSLCYLSYLLYLHLALRGVLLRPTLAALAFAHKLFLCFGIGLGGYLLVPALGPGRAFPGLFPAALEGSWLSVMNTFVVSSGSSVYDVFPSLHVLITCVLLQHDRQHHKLRFQIMLVPALGLFVSTLYLRYHYGIDLLASLFIFALVSYAEPRLRSAEWAT